MQIFKKLSATNFVMNLHQHTFCGNLWKLIWFWRKSVQN